MTDAPKRPGPKLGITPERTDAICAALAEGLSREDAAEEAEIHRCTLYEWLSRGAEQLQRRDAGDDLDEEQERLLAFYLAVKAVVRKRKRERLQAIAGAETATVLARETYLLEQFAPDEFGRRSKHEVTGKDGEALKIEIDANALAARIAALSAAGAAASTASEASGDAAGPLASGASSDRGGSSA